MNPYGEMLHIDSLHPADWSERSRVAERAYPAPLAPFDEVAVVSKDVIGHPYQLRDSDSVIALRREGPTGRAERLKVALDSIKKATIENRKQSWL